MSSARRFPSEVEFASFLVYSPRGTSEVSAKSRVVMRMVKLDPAQFARHVPRMRVDLPEHTRDKFLSGDTTLVPVPGSAPLREPNSRWSARQLAEAMVAAGLGAQVLPCLERVAPVRKSAFQARGSRPSVEDHYDSMRATSDVAAGSSITLVDDILTAGRTMLAAAARVQEAFPEASVRAFAVIRTMGFVAEVPRILEPCEGTISWDGVDARRSP